MTWELNDVRVPFPACKPRVLECSRTLIGKLMFDHHIILLCNYLFAVEQFSMSSGVPLNEG